MDMESVFYLIIIIVITVTLFIVPFIPAWNEWKYKTDAETFKVDFPSGAEHVQIINFLGTIILEKHLSGQLSEEFIITQTGMYFIVISLGNHIITTKLLVTN